MSKKCPTCNYETKESITGHGLLICDECGFVWRTAWLDDHDRALLRAFRDWEIALMNKSSPDDPRLKGEEWCRLSGDDLIDRFLKERDGDT